MGFTKNIFLQFCNLSSDDQSFNKFLQEAHEEGVCMGGFARSMLLLLDWPIEEIEKKATNERIQSHLKYRLHPLDYQLIDNMNPRVNLYLTGDNTTSPNRQLIKSLTDNMLANKTRIENFIQANEYGTFKQNGFDSIGLVAGILTRVSLCFKAMDQCVNNVLNKTLNHLVKRKAKSLLPDQSLEKHD